MGTDYMDNLIVKYLNHSINMDELDELISWLQRPGNMEIFKDFAKIKYSVDFKLGNYDTEEVKKFLLKTIRKDKKAYAKKRLLKLSKYAAILAVIVGALFIFQTENPATNTSGPFLNEQSITLELENGRSVILREEATRDIVSEKGEVIGKQINQGIQYEDTQLSDLVYNTLRVPNGKKFQVTFSDGTKVFLNAGSSIRFPVKFISGVDRKVFLTGEAYFDVAKNKDPFIVNADNLDIRVLGTQFNVSAYPEDQALRTVLVEGSVELLTKNFENNTKTLLLPEQEAIWDKIEESISVAETDISATTAWMNDQLIFRGVAFRDIVKKLERSYNCTIINKNHSLQQEIFTATFNVELESIEQVMAYFSKNSPYQYTIDKDKIITIN